MDEGDQSAEEGFQSLGGGLGRRLEKRGGPFRQLDEPRARGHITRLTLVGHDLVAKTQHE